MKILLDGWPEESRKGELISRGVELCAMAYQHQADPQSMTTGVITSSLVVAWVKQNLGSDPNGLLCLDFEEPMGSLLGKPVENVKREKCVRSMRAVCVSLRKQFPKLSVSFYGEPALTPYPKNIGTWNQVDEATKIATTQQYFDRANLALSECGWLAPCIYDSNMYGGLDDSGEIDYRVRRINLAKSLTPVNRPVIPFLCMELAPNGVRPDGHEMLSLDRFMSLQVTPCLKANADGIALWGAYGHYSEVACTHAPSDLQTVLRKAFTEGFALTPGFFDGDPQLALSILRNLIHDRVIRFVDAIASASP